MRLRSLALLLLVFALAMPAVAQEQRGAIEGIVKDSSGAVLPGVTVEIRNTAVGSVATAVSDGAGNYRFPAVAPGTYEVTATLQGFNTKKFENVIVLLGQIKKVDFALGVGGVAESIQVSAEAPLVDVRQSARATSLRDEQIDLLPKGRDFTTLVTQAPGANQEGKLGGLSIDGASAGENRYIVDGVETTNLKTGVSGKNLIADFLEEVQVKSSGYTAEYGGATGGVVNAVTKSGTNSFRGNALFYWEGDKLEDNPETKILRLNPSTNAAEYIDYKEDKYNRFELGGSLGGPIVKDRMWFFGAYQPTMTTTDRSVTLLATSQGLTRQRKDTNQYVSANTTGQWGNNFRTRLAYNNSWAKRTGLLPSQAGTDAAGTVYDIDRTSPNWSLSGTADWVAAPNFFVGLRGGYYFSNFYDEGVPTADRLWYSPQGNIGLVGLNGVTVPSQFQFGAGYQNILTNSATIYDEQTRLNFQVDSTYYGNFGGQHTIKGGVQFDRVGNNVLSGEQGNLVRIRWGLALSGQRGNYGYYQVRSNGVDPQKGFITEGDASTTNIGLFLQDAWTVNNKLTINLGVRTERERVPTYSKEAGVPKYGVEFDFQDKLAPRIGFAYDIKGDGKWKAFGSWGVFYDIFKLELPRGSFGGDKWLEYYYTLDNPDPTQLTSGANCPPACNGTLIRGPIDFRHPSFGADAIDPDLEPMRMQEASFGVEHQLTNVLALSVRYVHKQIDRAIEDLGALDAQQNEIYIVGNPGHGLATKVFDHNGVIVPGVAFPEAKRDYDSVEFALSKNLSNNWYARASYLWSRLYGNYSGLSQSDENGRTSPNVGRAFDFPAMAFNGKGQAEYGLLATDRPHQFKAQAIYVLPFGTSVGANFYMSSGIPVTREIGIFPPNNLPVQYLGRGSDGRTPMMSQVDMNVSHSFKFAGNKQVQLSFNVLNLFNQRIANSKFTTYQLSSGVNIDETAFYAGRVNFDTLIAQQGVQKDPRFLMDNGFQAPISARFGLKFIF